jgi:hypothetical protein
MTDHAHLDTQVHEHVMGQTWDVSRCRVCGWWIDPNGVGCTPDHCSMRPLPNVSRADSIPPYSTDLATAWRVVEHLREQGWWVKITYKIGIFPHDPQTPGYKVEFQYVWNVDVPSSRYRYGLAETLPDSICLAALQVMS